MIGVTACLRFTTRVSFRSPVLIFTSHNLVYILSRKHASRPITARVPFSFFINTLCAWKANIPGFPLRLSVFLFTPVFICTNKIELNYVQAYLRSCLNLKLLSLSSDSLWRSACYGQRKGKKVNESFTQIEHTKIHSHCRVKHKGVVVTPARSTSLTKVKCGLWNWKGQ